MMRTEGIVLSKRNSYNDDVFLTIFTEKYGQMNVVAKRSKSYRSPLNAATRVFVRADFILKPARTPYIVSADVVTSNLSILDDFSRIANATYLSEIVLKCTREDVAEKEIYGLLKESLTLLAEDAVSPHLIRACAAVKLCRFIGIMPDISGENPVASEELSAFLNADPPYRDEVKFIRFIRYLIAVPTTRLRRTSVDENLLRAAVRFSERLMKEFLDISVIKSNEMIDLTFQK